MTAPLPALLGAKTAIDRARDEGYAAGYAAGADRAAQRERQARVEGAVDLAAHVRVAVEDALRRFVATPAATALEAEWSEKPEGGRHAG